MSNNFVYTGVERICAISDIHGDLDALLIALVDCAKIIKRNIAISEEEFERNKNLPYGTEYDASLAYEWCGGKTFLIIVGDILDNCRPSKPDKGKLGTRLYENGTMPLKRDGEILNEDIKILLFIQFLMRESIKTEGRVILLCGNHELKNFEEKTFIKNYNTPLCLEQSYDGIKRNMFFKNSAGINLLKNINENNNLGIIAKINEYIFVHGGINPHIFTSYFNSEDTATSFINKINDSFNKFIINNMKNIEESTLKRNIVDSIKQDIFSANMDVNYTNFTDEEKWKEDKNGGIVWNRLFSDINQIDTNENELCDNLYIILKKLESIEDPNIKLVVGHCPQHESMANDDILKAYESGTFGGTKNRTYNKISHNDKIFIISSEPSSVYNNPDSLTHYGMSTDKFLFGMTLGCPNKNIGDTILNTDYKIYRIDTGISRAFDYVDSIKLIENANLDIRKNFLRTILARSPSILELTPTKNSIIRSTLENTLNYQKRIFINLADAELVALIKQVDAETVNVNTVDPEVEERKTDDPKVEESKTVDPEVEESKTVESRGGDDKTKDKIELDSINKKYYLKYLKYKSKYFKLKENNFNAKK